MSSKQGECNKFDIAVIEAVKKYPVLYKRAMEKRPGIAKERQKCWSAVAKEVGANTALCTTRWKHIKGIYRKKIMKDPKYDDPNLDFLKLDLQSQGVAIDDRDHARHLIDRDIGLLPKPEPQIGTSIENENDPMIISNNDKFTNSEKTIPFNNTNIQASTSNYGENSEIVTHPQESITLSYGSHLANTLRCLNSTQGEIGVLGLHSVGITNPNPGLITMESDHSEEIDETRPDSNDPEESKPQSSDLESSKIEDMSNDDIDFGEGFNLTPTKMPSQTTNDDIKTFFSDLTKYITNRFSLTKQKEIQSQIHSLLVSEEMKRRGAL